MTFEAAGGFGVHTSGGDQAPHLVIDVTGPMDVGHARALSDVLERPGPVEHVVVDLTDARFISAEGLSILVRAADHAQHQGRSLSVRNGPPRTRRLLEALGLGVDHPSAAHRPPDPYPVDLNSF